MPEPTKPCPCGKLMIQWDRPPNSDEIAADIFDTIISIRCWWCGCGWSDLPLAHPTEDEVRRRWEAANA